MDFRANKKKQSIQATLLVTRSEHQPFWLNRPGQLAGNSERAREISFSPLYFYFFKV